MFNFNFRKVIPFLLIMVLLAITAHSRSAPDSQIKNLKETFTADVHFEKCDVILVKLFQINSAVFFKDSYHLKLPESYFRTCDALSKNIYKSPKFDSRTIIYRVRSNVGWC